MEQNLILEDKPKRVRASKHENARTTNQKMRKGTHHTIMFPSTGAPHESQWVFAGVNGVTYWMQRGVPVPNIPAPVVQVLRDAKTRKVIRKKTVLGNGRTVYINNFHMAQSYPFEVLETYDGPKILT